MSNKYPLLLVALLLLGTFPQSLSQHNASEKPVDPQSWTASFDMLSRWNQAMETQNYTRFGFSVYDDTDLQALVSAENWAGNGSAASPYVISGYNFSGYSPYDAVYLSHTSLHVIFYNNIFVDNGIGLTFNQAENVNITGNYFATNDYGIHINTMNQTMIHNNTFYHNTNGISIFNAESTPVTNNIFYEQTDCALLSSVDSTTVRSNLFYNNSLSLDIDSSGFDISYNYFLEGDLTAMINSNDGGTISHNTFEKIGGITTDFSEHLVIDSNVFLNTSSWGLSYHSTGNTTLTNNIFNQSYFVIQDISILDSFIQTKVENNTVNGKPLLFIQNENGTSYSGEFGQILVVNSTNITLDQVKVSQIVENGILLFNSLSITITNSTIEQCFRGIKVLFTDYLIIRNSTIRGNGDGVYYWISRYSTVIYNSFFNNSYSALYIEGNHHTIKWNNFLYNTYFDDFGGYYGTQAYFDGLDPDFDYNFWHDHKGPDADGDGIVDQPYQIETGSYMDAEDPHPVTKAYDFSNFSQLPDFEDPYPTVTDTGTIHYPTSTSSTSTRSDTTSSNTTRSTTTDSTPSSATLTFSLAYPSFLWILIIPVIVEFLRRKQKLSR